MRPCEQRGVFHRPSVLVLVVRPIARDLAQLLVIGGAFDRDPTDRLDHLDVLVERTELAKLAARALGGLPPRG